MSLPTLARRNARKVRISSSGLSSTSKITESSVTPPSSHREVEGRARPGRGLGPHAATMTVDHALDDGQADPGPGKLVHGVQALERTEELARVVHVEADAVVAHGIGRAAGVWHGPEL